MVTSLTSALFTYLKTVPYLLKSAIALSVIDGFERSFRSIEPLSPLMSISLLPNGILFLSILHVKSFEPIRDSTSFLTDSLAPLTVFCNPSFEIEPRCITLPILAVASASKSPKLSSADISEKPTSNPAFEIPKLIVGSFKNAILTRFSFQISIVPK